MTQARRLATLVATAAMSLSALGAHAEIAKNALVKSADSPSVFFVGSDDKRYVIPDEKTYLSWFDDFAHVQEVETAEIEKLPIGGTVTFRPGVRMVKVATDPKTYAVDKNGKLRWVKTEEVATALYGERWNRHIEDIPDYMFAAYEVGEPVDDAADFDPDIVSGAVKTLAADFGLADAAGAKESDTSPSEEVAVAAPVAAPAPEAAQASASPAPAQYAAAGAPDDETTERVATDGAAVTPDAPADAAAPAATAEIPSPAAALTVPAETTPAPGASAVTPENTPPAAGVAADDHAVSPLDAPPGATGPSAAATDGTPVADASPAANASPATPPASIAPPPGAMVLASCVINQYTCTEWSVCSGSKQTRTCGMLGYCADATNGKPPEERACGKLATEAGVCDDMNAWTCTDGSCSATEGKYPRTCECGNQKMVLKYNCEAPWTPPANPATPATNS